METQSATIAYLENEVQELQKVLPAEIADDVKKYRKAQEKMLTRVIQ
jgi:hypothetical protein